MNFKNKPVSMERTTGYVLFLGSLLLTGVGFYSLWGCETNYKEMVMAATQMQKKAVAISNSSVDPLNNNKLVYFSGLLNTTNPVRDPVFKVQAKALVLRRNVVMYQWRQRGGKVMMNRYKSLSYKKEWMRYPVFSEHFKYASQHQNPGLMRFENESWDATRCVMGDFVLSAPFIKAISAKTPLAISEDTLSQFNSALNTQFKLKGNTLYSGSIQNPHVGDFKIQFFVARPQVFSVLGLQKNNAIQPFDYQHEAYSIIEPGVVSLKTMLLRFKEKYRAIIWFSRAGSIVFLLAGLRFFILFLFPGMVENKGVLTLSLVSLTTLVVAFILMLTWY